MVRTVVHLLTLSKRPENWAQTQEKVLKKQLAEQHATKARLGEELARLVKIARTSDRPPEALLVEMRELEKQQSAALENISRVSTEKPSKPVGLWSRGFFTHPQRFDGIIYRTRHNPRLRCIALRQTA